MGQQQIATTQKPTAKTSYLTDKTARNADKTPRARRQALTFVAGILAALPLTVAAAVPWINREVSAGVASAPKTVQVKTVDDTLACAQPGPTGGLGGGGGGGAGGGEVLGEATTPLPTGGVGGETTPTPPPFVEHLVGGMGASGTINNTGPGSNNTITSNQSSVANLTNNNTVNVTNSNTQSATTGDANVSGNTTGGSAQSGDASNQNSTDLSISITN